MVFHLANHAFPQTNIPAIRHLIIDVYNTKTEPVKPGGCVTFVRLYVCDLLYAPKTVNIMYEA